MIGPSEHERLRDLLLETGLQQVEDLILARSHPMILIGLEDLTIREERRPLDEMPIGASRWGSHPDVPRDFVWPSHRDGNPMHFLMQLDLARLPKFADWPLPEQGRLYFFAGMTNDDYAIGVQAHYSAADSRDLLRTAAPLFPDGDLFLEYFPNPFEPFLLTGSLGIDIQYRDAERRDLIELIEARYPGEDWSTLLNRYETLANRAADVRHAQLERSGYPRQWWQVGQLFGVTQYQHEQDSIERDARRSSASTASRWRQLASLGSNTITGFDSLCDARPYRLLTRVPSQTPWTQFDIETHVDMG